MYDILIVGGGVTGASVARRLSRYKLKIAVLEKELDISMGASKANTAIVHGGYAEGHDELRGRICYPGRKEFKKLDEELNFGFMQNGSLVVGFDEGDKKEIQRLYEQGLENGLDDMELLQGEEILELEPNINENAKYALYCKGAGILSPYEYVIALMENAVDNGADLFTKREVVAIEKVEDYFLVKDQTGQEYKARYVVNASGLNGAKVSELVAKTDFTIHPRSGQYLLMRRGTGERLNSTIFQVPTDVSKGVLVAKTYHNNLIIGPDALDEEDLNKDTDLERLAAIYKGAKKSVDESILDINEFIRSFSGLRPASSTGDFVIEESNVKGFINAVGIQSPGITASPMIAKLVEEILVKSGLKLEEDPNYDPIRPAIYQEVDYKPMDQVAKKVNLEIGDPDRIICRCEQIKETTVLDAMGRSTPVETLDAVKRRTKASTGICQGQFCRPRIVELFEHEGKELYDEKTDVEREDVSRVKKKDLVEYIKDQEI